MCDFVIQGPIFFLQLRQQKRWFIVHVVHAATTQNRTGPESHRSKAKDQRDHFDMSKVGLSKVVEAMDVLDPLRQVLDSRHAVQHLVPASPASGFPCFRSCGFQQYISRQFPGTSASSFCFCTLACAFASSSTWLLLAGRFLRRWC